MTQMNSSLETSFHSNRDIVSFNIENFGYFSPSFSCFNFRTLQSNLFFFWYLLRHSEYRFYPPWIYPLFESLRQARQLLLLKYPLTEMKRKLVSHHTNSLSTAITRAFQRMDSMAFKQSKPLQPPGAGETCCWPTFCETNPEFVTKCSSTDDSLVCGLSISSSPCRKRPHLR